MVGLQTLLFTDYFEKNKETPCILPKIILNPFNVSAKVEDTTVISLY